MSKTALICGSYAFDSVMAFHDQFKNHILSNQINMLNVSFLTPDLRKEFGGCAGNIAYNLHLLGAKALPMATVGEDFSPYMKWMKKHKINTKHIKVITGTYTGQAFITTDTSNNQITFFHPGAMGESHQNSVINTNNIDIGIISPDGRDGMIQHSTQFHQADIPFIFDPGQGMSMFSGEELLQFIKQANYIAVNAYEAQMLQDKTKLDLNIIANKVEALIITKDDKGSEIYTNNQLIKIAPIKATVVQDPTGCGDAYRAGLLYGLMNGMDWQTIGRLAGLLGTIKVAYLGTQNHKFDRFSINKMYQKNYHKTLFADIKK